MLARSALSVQNAGIAAGRLADVHVQAHAWLQLEAPAAKQLAHGRPVDACSAHSAALPRTACCLLAIWLPLGCAAACAAGRRNQAQHGRACCCRCRCRRSPASHGSTAPLNCLLHLAV